MNALPGLISLAILVYLVLGPLNELRVDYLRHRLFVIRTRLFEEAAAERISFDSHAYQYTRTVINGMLRFGHRVSFARALTARLVMKKADVRTAVKCQQWAMDKSTDGEREIAQRYLRDANIAVMKHLATSPFVGLMLIPAIAWILMVAAGFSVFTWILRLTPTLQLKLDQAAFEEGRIVRDHRELGTSATAF
ncbi:MAG TPA: hypothetical protein VIN75_05835 [Burkholderiaceae bacterium]